MAGLLAAAAAAVPLGVSEREWRVGVYAASVPRGTYALNVHNYGEDAHDLRVLGPRGYRSATSAPIAPGATEVLVVRLRRPGTYRLVCALPGHARRGMRVSLRVR